MDETAIIKRKLSVEKYFLKTFPHQSDHCSDFGSWCVEQWLTHKREVRTEARLMAIDFLRTFSHHHKDKTGHTRGSSDALNVHATKVKKPEKCYTLGIDSRELNRFENKHLFRHSSLSSLGRAYLILHFEWGLSLKEIGDVFGYGESRACQVLKEILKDHKPLLKIK